MNINELRDVFEKETQYKAIGKNGTYHSRYGKWLENKVVKKCSIPDVIYRREMLVCDKNELDCPYDFTSRCTMGRCDCKPKAN